MAGLFGGLKGNSMFGLDPSQFGYAMDANGYGVGTGLDTSAPANANAIYMNPNNLPSGMATSSPMAMQYAQAPGGAADAPAAPFPAAPSGPAPTGFFGKLGSAPQPSPSAPSLQLSPTTDQPTFPSKLIDTSQLHQDVNLSKPGLFERMGIHNVGDALGALSSIAVYGPGAPLVWQMRRLRRDAEQQKEQQDLQKAVILERMKGQIEANKPQYTTNGHSWLRFDPTTGTAAPIYQTPTEEQQFAADMGLTPGTREYYDAIANKGLGAQGPANMGFRRQEFGETVRHDRASEGIGWSNAGTAASNAGDVTPGKVVGPILSKIARGQPLSPGEQSALDRYKAMDPLNAIIGSMYSGTPGSPLPPTMPRARPQAPVRPAPAAPRSPGPAIGQTATNPATGKRIRWNGQGWVPLN